tara:strand:+ start:1641 stop:3311 length:1671 start_codon:yes stop_codon:yes gene_type:complete
MAEWKKIVVSGSDISQLLNDSGYLSGSQNIASASVAARATTLSADATASFALVAGTARAADSASVAARATTLSPAATASQADSATTASFAASGDGLFSGSFSGSFVGDGSALTGVAGTLTVDGDTGTADVDLIDDDLQIIGTAGKISTAITKVGNDVKVTLDLPATILATASYAQTASNADNAISASATNAGVAFPSADGLANQALVTDGAGQFAYGDIFGTGSTKKLNQSSAATTWSFQHSLNEVYPIVQAYDAAGDQLLPERVESIDADNIKLYFAVATTGVAAAMVGGMGVSASNSTRATSASIADLASTLSSTATASIANTATSASHTFGTASFADLASTARNATTASHALGGAGAFSGSFIGDGSGLSGVAGDFNFSGDTGATTINLLSETASFAGTAQEIVTTVTDDTLTISLPDDVTIGDALTVTGNATVGGNLIVNGSIVSASSLAIADQFIILASGSNGAIDGGIIVNQIDDDPDGKGKAFAFDSSANRWAIESNLNDTASVITPDAFMGVIQEGSAEPSTAPTYGGTNGLGTIFVDGNNDEAYIYV